MSSLVRVLPLCLVPLALACESRASGPSASTFVTVNGVSIQELQTDLHLEITDELTTVRMLEVEFRVAPSVPFEYELLDGALTRTSGAADVERPASPSGMWIAGHPLDPRAGRLRVGPHDFGAISAGSEIDVGTDGIRVDGALRGELPAPR